MACKRSAVRSRLPPPSDNSKAFQEVRKARQVRVFYCLLCAVSGSVIPEQPTSSRGNCRGMWRYPRKSYPHADDTVVRNAKPGAKPVKRFDERALFVLMTPSGGSGGGSSTASAGIEKAGDFRSDGNDTLFRTWRGAHALPASTRCLPFVVSIISTAALCFGRNCAPAFRTKACARVDRMTKGACSSAKHVRGPARRIEDTKSRPVEGKRHPEAVWTS